LYSGDTVWGGGKIKNMRKLFLLLIVFCLSKTSFSQRTEEWKQYLKDSVYNSDKPEYIYLYFTKGGKFLKTLYYYTKKSQNVLSINYGDSEIVNKIIHNPNLFEIVNQNLKKIIKAKDFQTTQKKIKEHKGNFSDSSIVYTQLGIKYHDLHYNHFQKFTSEQIENQKNNKRKEGMIIINQLYEILEKAERNK
jgi:hypothetical protein